MHSFRDVETAAYCPRKLYYRRREPNDEETPDVVVTLRELAFAYERILDGADLDGVPIECPPTQVRTRLGQAKARLDHWDRLADPAERDVFLSGRDCHGIAHKVLATDPPEASLVFAGDPPERGVWHPQSVRLMAVAKALSWEHSVEVERVYAEYPAHGVVRAVDVDGRRTGAYREAVRVADAIDGPPGRTSNPSKCDPCEFRPRCGVRTRSLRSLLGD